MRTMLAAMAGTLVATGAAAGPLDALRWEKRMLVVFAQGDADRLAAQKKAIDRAGMAERDLVLIEVPRDGTATAKGAGQIEARTLRRAYAVAEDAPFTALLIGKDGGVKLRSGEPIGADELFDTVDAMPMRANEMAKRR